MHTDRPSGAEEYGIFEGFSQRRVESGEEKEPSLDEALKNLWERSAGRRKDVLRVVEIEIYGSNPIDMFHVTGTDH